MKYASEMEEEDEGRCQGRQRGCCSVREKARGERRAKVIKYKPDMPRQEAVTLMISESTAGSNKSDSDERTESWKPKHATAPTRQRHPCVI